jgi:hypothetical protein
MVNSKQVREALVFHEEDNEARWLDALGSDVTKFELETGTPMDDTTGDPTRFVTTVVEAGVGDSLTINAASAGEKLLITDAANEFDGVCLTLRGEAFRLTAAKPFYFGAKIKSSRTDADFVLGMCETLAAYLAAAAHTVIAANLEGAFFFVGTTAAIKAQVYKDNVQSSTADAASALGTAAHVYEVYWDGTYVNFYYDGVLVTQTATTLADGDLTPVLHFRNGSANVTTCTVSWMRAIQVN